MYRVARWKFFGLLLLFFSAFALLIPQKSWGQTNFSSGNTAILEKGRTINEDYFTSGATVVVSGTVNGDVYAAGGNVLVDGTVNGDVLAAGGNVTINGKVTGNVRVAGGQVTLGADVGKNVTAAGGNITFQNPAKIAGSLTAAGGTVEVLSPIGKGATFACNQLSIDSAIGGNVNAAVQSIQISSGSHIAGSLNYWSNTKANIPNGTAVKGIAFHYTNSNTHHQPSQGAFGFNLVWELVSLMSAFILGVIILWLAPVFMGSMTTTLTIRLGTSLLVGLVTIIVIPIGLLVLLITIIGIPLAFILLGIFLIWVYLNKIFISYAIGKKLLPEKNVLALLVGLMIYGIISIIPIIGGIWGFVTLLAGLGAFILTEKNMYLWARTKKII